MTKNYFSDEILREIQLKNDMVDIVSETTRLTRKGRNYWGICPFHQESTASFSVNQDKQVFYCFGCNAGGNLFSFVMKRDSVGFKEAVEYLAEKTGVELKSSYNSQDQDDKKNITKLNTLAADIYHQNLIENEKAALQYLKNRGITEDSIKEFKLGFAPESWDFIIKALRKKGYKDKEIFLAGLLKEGKNNTYYDLFRDRIIFPIFQYNSEIIAFGGRTTGTAQPKYLNTAETQYYSKRKNLYGINNSKSVIRKLNEVILVEGYMDCIKLYQAGIQNVVASLGTAFTEDQAKLLNRYAEKVIILFDGDEAGQRETLRTIDIVLKEGLKLDVISLPAGKDPDDCIDLLGKEEFCNYIKNNRISAFEFKLRYLMQDIDIRNMESKITLIKKLSEDFFLVNSEIKKDYYIKILAKQLQIEEKLVQKEMYSKKDSKIDYNLRNNFEILRNNKRYDNYGIQEKVLAKILTEPELFKKVKKEIGLNVFSNLVYRKLALLYEKVITEAEPLNKLADMVLQEGLSDTYAKIVFLMEDKKILDEVDIKEFIERVKYLKIQTYYNKLLEKTDQLKQTGGFYEVMEHILELEKFMNITREEGKK